VDLEAAVSLVEERQGLQTLAQAVAVAHHMVERGHLVEVVL
jgi:hypothetical protein